MHLGNQSCAKAWMSLQLWNTSSQDWPLRMDMRKVFFWVVFFLQGGQSVIVTVMLNASNFNLTDDMNFF